MAIRSSVRCCSISATSDQFLLHRLLSIFHQLFCQFQVNFAFLSNFSVSSTSDLNGRGSTSQASCILRAESHCCHLVTQTVWCCSGPILSWCHRSLSRCSHLYHLLHLSLGLTKLLPISQYHKLFWVISTSFYFIMSAWCNSAYRLSHYIWEKLLFSLDHLFWSPIILALFLSSARSGVFLGDPWPFSLLLPRNIFLAALWEMHTFTYITVNV